MGLANAKHDILLNGSGYSLISESYRRRAQQPFSPRFSTGDPSYGDLSFWQFLKQESWDGGAGQIIFSTVTKHKRSSGWSFLTDKPRLAGGNSSVALTTGITALNTVLGTNVPSIHQMFLFGKTNNETGKIVLVGRTASGTQDASVVTNRAASATAVGIVHIASRAAFLLERSRDLTGGAGTFKGRYLACDRIDGGAPTNEARIFDSEFSTCVDTDLEDQELFAGIQTANNKALFLGPGQLPISGGNGKYLRFQYKTYNNNLWTSSDTVRGHSSDFPYQLSPHVAIDSAGTIYFAGISDDTVMGQSNQAEHSGSAVGLITSTDLAEAAGPRMSERVHYPDFIISGCVAINGTVFLIGCRVRRKSNNNFKPAVIQFPNTVVWEAQTWGETLAQKLPRAICQVNRSEALFCMAESNSDYLSVMRLTTGGRVDEAYCSKEQDTASDNVPTAICRYNKQVFIYSPVANEIRVLTDNPADTRASTGKTCSLFLSDQGGNTPLINKTLYTVTVELSEALPSGETMTVKINGTTVGTIANSDGTRKEITLTTEITSGVFTPQMDMPGTSTWDGNIERVTLRYIPTQFKKLAWAFGIRIDRNLKLIDGSRETTSPTTKLAALKTAWSSNTPITLVDIDGTSYTVILTDIDIRMPLINQDSTKKEAFLFIEALEV